MHRRGDLHGVRVAAEGMRNEDEFIAGNEREALEAAVTERQRHLADGPELGR